MKPILVAHRGGASESSWTDNSLEAIIYSISHARSDYLEVDVRETREGEYVLFHDEKVNSIPVNAMSYEELTDTAGYSVVKLMTLLRILSASSKKVNIEIKKVNSVEALVKTVLDVLGNEKVLFSSFDKTTINEIDSLDKNIKKAIILSVAKELDKARWIFKFDQAMSQAETKHVVVPFLAIKLGLLSKVSSREYTIWSWGINHQKDMIKALSDNRISGIITDYPTRFENIEKMLVDRNREKD